MKKFKKNNKKAWLRIFEASIAILLLLGVIMIVLNKSNTQNTNSEIPTLERNILVSISQDQNLRNQVLAGNKVSLEGYVSNLKPRGLDYSVNICSVEDICPLQVSSEIIINRDIYADSIIIASNSTTYEEKQLKIFFWRV